MKDSTKNVSPIKRNSPPVTKMLFVGHWGLPQVLTSRVSTRAGRAFLGRDAAERDRTKNFNYESLVCLAFSILVLPSLNKVLLTYLVYNIGYAMTMVSRVSQWPLNRRVNIFEYLGEKKLELF